MDRGNRFDQTVLITLTFFILVVLGDLYSRRIAFDKVIAAYELNTPPEQPFGQGVVVTEFLQLASTTTGYYKVLLGLLVIFLSGVVFL